MECLVFEEFSKSMYNLQLIIKSQIWKNNTLNNLSLINKMK